MGIFIRSHFLPIHTKTAHPQVSRIIEAKAY